MFQRAAPLVSDQQLTGAIIQALQQHASSHQHSTTGYTVSSPTFAPVAPTSNVHLYPPSTHYTPTPAFVQFVAEQHATQPAPVFHPPSPNPRQVMIDPHHPPAFAQHPFHQGAPAFGYAHAGQMPPSMATGTIQIPVIVPPPAALTPTIVPHVASQPAASPTAPAELRPAVV